MDTELIENSLYDSQLVGNTNLDSDKPMNTAFKVTQIANNLYGEDNVNVDNTMDDLYTGGTDLVDNVTYGTKDDSILDELYTGGTYLMDNVMYGTKGSTPNIDEMYSGGTALIDNVTYETKLDTSGTDDMYTAGTDLLDNINYGVVDKKISDGEFDIYTGDMELVDNQNYGNTVESSLHDAPSSMKTVLVNTAGNPRQQYENVDMEQLSHQQPNIHSKPPPIPAKPNIRSNAIVRHEMGPDGDMYALPDKH